MFSKNEKEPIFNKVLIGMGVVAGIFSATVISLSCLKKADIDIFAKSIEQLVVNYTSEEVTTYTWDISENSDESITAVLDQYGTLTITGNGAMKEYDMASDVPWNDLRDKIKVVKMKEGLTNISSNAFCDCQNLKRVQVPTTITEIGASAFSSTKIASIKIPEGVTIIKENTFKQCHNLEKLELPESLTEIGDYAFSHSRIIKLKIPDNVTIIGESAFDGNYALEKLILGEKLEVIGKSAFYYNQSLKELILPDSLKTIGDSAFGYCEALESVVIPEGVTTIGDSAFGGCSSLKQVELPTGITSLDSVFSSCYELTNITIPDSVTNMDFTFFMCSKLESIEIPSGVTVLDSFTFLGCDNLKEIKVKEGNTKYFDDNGVLYCNEGYLERERKTLLKYPAKKADTTYTILSETGYIDSFAFENCVNLTSIEIPEGITSIPPFEGCTSLTRIDIPDSVTAIDGVRPFDNCDNLTEINVGENNTTYFDDNGVLYSFYDLYASDEIRINLVKYPPKKVDTTYTILSGTTTIRVSAFEKSKNLTNIIIPSTVTSIELGAFEECENLYDLEIPDTVTEIDGGTIGCNIVKYIDSQTKVIELNSMLKRAFTEGDILYREDIRLENCIIEDSKIIIDEDKSYATIELSGYPVDKYIFTIKEWDVSEAGDESIIATFSEDGTFEITGTGRMKEFGENASDIPWNCIKYKINEVKIAEGITNIPSRYFYECNNLINVDIPNSITSIGKNAFAKCKSIEEIELIDTIDTIGERAFEGCENLKTINIPSDLTYIPTYMFAGCSKLTSINIPSNIITIEDYAFQGCNGFTSLVIPDTVETIGDGAFDSCENLTNIKLPSGLEMISEGLFWNCYSLEEVEIPDTVTYIEIYSFGNCFSLTEIQISSKVQTIDDRFILGHTSLININVDDENINYFDDNGVLYSKDSTTNQPVELIAYPIARTDTEYTILDGTTILPYETFSDCKNLVTINIPDSVIDIGGGTFYGCENLTSLKFPNNITEIEAWTYAKTYSMTSIYIPPTVTSIQEGSFEFCSYLTIYCYKNSVAEKYAIENGFDYVIVGGVEEGLNPSNPDIDVDEDNSTIGGIEPGTTPGELIEELNPNEPYEILDPDGNVIDENDDNVSVGTGFQIKLENGKIYVIIVIGDIDSNGYIDLYDILRLIELVFDTDSSYVWDESIKQAGKCAEESTTETPDLYDILRLIEYHFDNKKW